MAGEHDRKRDEEVRFRATGMSWREVGDEIIVLDLDQSRYVNLNGSAAVMWRRIRDGACVEDLVNALLDEYEVEPDRARADALALIDDLRDLGLLAL